MPKPKSEKTMKTKVETPPPQTSKLRLSHNRINTWLNCHWRYHLYYNEKLVPKEERSYQLQVGDVVHRLLHKWYIGEMDLSQISELDKFVQNIFPEITEAQALDVAIEATNLFNGYVNQWGVKDPLKFLPGGEVQVELEFPDYILFGRIDALARTKDKRLWRVEHKTAARMDSHYLGGLKGGLQGAIYDYLIENTMKEQVQGTIYNLLLKTKIPSYHRAYTAINRAAIKRMLQTVDGVYRDIQRGDFYPSSNCFTYNRECAYRLLCNNDTKAVREQFYTVRENQKEEVKNGNTEEASA